MSRRAAASRAILALVGVLSAAIAVPHATAAPAVGRLEVSGSGSAVMEIVLRTASEVRPNSFRMRTTGAYAGLALQDGTGRVRAVVMNVKPWIDSRPSAADTPVETANVFQKTILPPGRYRLMLLADAPSVVSVEVTGDLARKFRPSRPYADRVELTDISDSLTDTGAAAHQATVPADFRRSRFMIVAHHRETKAVQGEVTQFCLTPVGQGYCNPYANTGGSRVMQNIGGLPGDGWQRSELSGPTVDPTGGYDVRGLFDARFSGIAADLPNVKSYALVVVI